MGNCLKSTGTVAGGGKSAACVIGADGRSGILLVLAMGIIEILNFLLLDGAIRLRTC
jgi:hypothetical protein